jgi:hypothetical protein
MKHIIVVMAAVLLGGCATWEEPVEWNGGIDAMMACRDGADIRYHACFSRVDQPPVNKVMKPVKEEPKEGCTKFDIGLGGDQYWLCDKPKETPLKPEEQDAKQAGESR